MRSGGEHYQPRLAVEDDAEDEKDEEEQEEERARADIKSNSPQPDRWGKITPEQLTKDISATMALATKISVIALISSLTRNSVFPQPQIKENVV